MRHKKLSFTTRYVIAFGLFLLAVNIVLGIVILQRSEAAMSHLIDKNMLDIVNSAAGFMDGDVLGAMTAEDVGGEVFNDVAQKLTVFQKNVNIRFIYAVKQVGEGEFAFTVDPDPDDPGEFGEPVVVTPALVQAGKGVAAVDSAPMADRWGNFYSAYSPVFDSAGNVAGIVGIDFDAEWYENQVWRHTVTISIITMISVLTGGVVVFMITHRVRSRFQELEAGLSKLSDSVDQLMHEVGAMSGNAVAGEIDDSQDEIEALGRRIQTMQKDMVIYLDYLQTQAYTDALTRVGSATAYHERIRKLDEAIAAGGAAFSVAVFDVNNLKKINDDLGHEYGDTAIRGAAEAAGGVFGPEHTYRIGGDEFAVVKDAITDAELAAFDAAIAAFNDSSPDSCVKLAVSRGAATFQPGTDAAFRQVFARADEAMYRDKKAYYETVGDRRARR